ncbi:MAG: hypothetical protein ACREKI_05460 [Gemmatimonadota bacterium]
MPERSLVARSASALALILTLSLVTSAPARAQEKRPQEDDPERAATLKRKGAGLRVGAWWVQDLAQISDAEYSQWPSFEGYFQKGLDLHLTIETTLGLWRRSQEIEESGLGGGEQRVQSFVIPAFTALKMYPFTRPADRLEPYLTAGVGLALGVDDREGSDLLGVGTGTAVLTGFGFKLGTGFDWNFGSAFGLSANGRYQWIRFNEELGGKRTYRGLGAEAGITYRFQFE